MIIALFFRYVSYSFILCLITICKEITENFLNRFATYHENVCLCVCPLSTWIVVVVYFFFFVLAFKYGRHSKMEILLCLCSFICLTQNEVFFAFYIYLRISFKSHLISTFHLSFIFILHSVGENSKHFLPSASFLYFLCCICCGCKIDYSFWVAWRWIEMKNYLLLSYQGSRPT
jgi:hypothetical protein